MAPALLVLATLFPAMAPSHPHRMTARGLVHPDHVTGPTRGPLSQLCRCQGGRNHSSAVISCDCSNSSVTSTGTALSPQTVWPPLLGAGSCLTEWTKDSTGDTGNVVDIQGHPHQFEAAFCGVLGSETECVACSLQRSSVKQDPGLLRVGPPPVPYWKDSSIATGRES